MKKKTQNLCHSPVFIKDADEHIKTQSAISSLIAFKLDNIKIRHELNEHKVLRKMQSNELILAKERAEQAAFKYSELYDFSPSAYFTLSRKGEITEMNLSAVNLLNTDRQHLIKSQFSSLLTDDSLIVFDTFLQKVFDGKTKKTCELSMIKNGDVSIDVYVEGITTQKGTHCLLTAVEISELKKNEEALKESRENLIEAQRIARIGSWKWNLKTGEVTWSDEMYTIFGIDKNTYTGELSDAISNVIHPDDSHMVLPLCDPEFTKNNPIEYRIILPDNSIRDICVKTSESSYYAKGKSLFLSGTAQDITERKKYERALKENVDKFRNLIALAVDGIIIGSHEGIIIEANTCFCQMCGQNRDSLIGKHIKDLFPTSSLADFPLNFESLKTGDIIITERELTRPDGTSISIEMRTKMMPDKTYQSIIRDITERKQTELILKEKNKKIQLQNEQYMQINEKLTQTNKELLVATKTVEKINTTLQKLNADKDRFMSILGHDLRSPFSALLGYSQLLKNNIHEYDIDKIKKFINIINNSINNYYNMLTDLLTWSRSQSGRIPFEPQKVCFTDTCVEVIENLELCLNTKNVTVNYNFSQEINVFADLNMLKTIIRNLITNSLKFTAKDGSISISAIADKKHVTITVANTGAGLLPDVIKKLFDPAQKTPVNETEFEDGSGLGLMLCRNFVDKHNGQIWVKCETGKGSTFYFKLPLFKNQL